MTFFGFGRGLCFIKGLGHFNPSFILSTTRKMHIILTGATGTVGAAVLRNCLASPTVTRLSILSRRQFTLPVGDGLDAQKAQIIVHDNFAAYPSSLTDLLKGAEGCVWAQGISQNEVSKE
jgi:uncharacterized protein YbjT (DUF2867 family)